MRSDVRMFLQRLRLLKLFVMLSTFIFVVGVGYLLYLGNTPQQPPQKRILQGNDLTAAFRASQDRKFLEGGDPAAKPSTSKFESAKSPPPGPNNPANVPSKVNPLADKPIESKSHVAVLPPGPAKPQYVWLSNEKRREIGAKLKSLINSKIVHNISDMPQARGADDPFVQAIGTYNAPKFEFILLLSSKSKEFVRETQLAIVCGRDQKIHWIFDLHGVDDKVGRGSPIIHVWSARPPGEKPEGFVYKKLSAGIFVTDDLPLKPSVTIIARLHDTPIPQTDNDADPMDFALFKHDGDVQSRAEFCNLQGQLVQN